MNVFSKNRVLKYLAYVMVVTQGMLLALVASFHMDARYLDKILDYPTSAVNMNLKSIPEKNIDSTLNYMKNYSFEHKIFYIRRDFILNKDGSIGGLNIAVYGNYEKNKDEIDFSFLGQNVIKENDIKKVLDSKDDTILGIEQSSLNSIGRIPKFRFGNNIVVKKLDQIVRETKTINGEYKILGLTQENIDSFIDGLSKSSGISKDVLLNNKSGYTLERGIMQKFLWISLIVHSVVLLSLFVVMTAKALPTLGKLILQGWSRVNFAVKLYTPYFLLGFLSIFLFLGYGIYLTEGTFFSIFYFSFMLAIGIINLLIISLLLVISSVFIFLVKPINAIIDRFPKRMYIVSGLILYVIFNVLMILGCSYIDGPYSEIQKNTEIAKKWNEVSDYFILKSVNVGNDQSSFNHQSKEFYKDMYNWYKSISEEKGVYIINTTYFSDTMLKDYKANNLYKFIPNRPLWVFKMSPNYLKKMGINVNENAINMAKQGYRVYLIPDNISKDDSNVIKNWLKEKDTRGIREDDIETVFNKEKKFDFINYHFEGRFFSWDTDLEKSLNVKNPVILLTTPNNMTYKESESLVAKGLRSSYMKLDENAVSKYLDSTYLSKFNLDDNNIEFSKIKLFVDGLQKQLWQTVQLFFVMIIAITFIIISLLITIISLFQVSYKEIIFVKRFLGYDNIKIYKTPILIILFIMIADLVAIVMLKSKIGIIYISVINILQLIVFYIIMINNEFKKIVDYLKL
ncbi:MULTISPECIES: hypothetical protein [unclassified Parvimonas]|uniref:hypothetical protein n=1 Tax=unclassified Parvimonas TaxID=1151464 RepID=UPI002B47410E|nr:MULTISPECIES: hypothetical protein [unclassified Parvimonas]MEB3025123.1 hypothetical protein [Parvimonas sp. M13]MEB3089221.1 hypothetical protein [Parvimonas sp. M20]